MATEEQREASAPVSGSNQGPPEPSASTVSRAAWIGGLAVGVLICAIGFGTLSMVSLPKLAEVAVEMITVAVALLTTTRIWQRSAVAGNNGEHGER